MVCCTRPKRSWSTTKHGHGPPDFGRAWKTGMPLGVVTIRVVIASGMVGPFIVDVPFHLGCPLGRSHATGTASRSKLEAAGSFPSRPPQRFARWSGAGGWLSGTNETAHRGAIPRPPPLRKGREPERKTPPPWAQTVASYEQSGRPLNLVRAHVCRHGDDGFRSGQRPSSPGPLPVALRPSGPLGIHRRNSRSPIEAASIGRAGMCGSGRAAPVGWPTAVDWLGDAPAG